MIGHGYTHVIAFNVRKREFFSEILGDGALATASGTGYDPHMPMVRRLKGAVDLLH